jgi:hypothetical protein
VYFFLVLWGLQIGFSATGTARGEREAPFVLYSFVFGMQVGMILNNRGLAWAMREDYGKVGLISASPCPPPPPLFFFLNFSLVLLFRHTTI